MDVWDRISDYAGRDESVSKEDAYEYVDGDESIDVDAIFEAADANEDDELTFQEACNFQIPDFTWMC